MKYTLTELLENCPEPYCQWPVYMKRILFAICEHYIHGDEKKATEFIMMLEEWVDKDNTDKASILSNIIGGTPLS